MRNSTFIRWGQRQLRSVPEDCTDALFAGKGEQP